MSSEKTDGIPFMVTAAMKEKLRELGFSDDGIANLKPEEANYILERGVTAAKWVDYLKAKAGAAKPREEEKVVPINKRAEEAFAARLKKVREGRDKKKTETETKQNKADEALRGLGLGEAKPKSKLSGIPYWWLDHLNRREYQGLVLRPDTLNQEIMEKGHRYLNLWRGFAVQPRQGNWSRMRSHIYEVLAAGDQGGGDYIIKWSAFGVQHPELRAEQALCFRGEEGIGKGTFANAYLQLFGEAHGFRVQSTRELTGDFNAHFRDRVVVLADEAIWGGDKAAESKLKGLITEPTFPLEGKGKDIIRWKNHLSFIVTGNAKWIVPAGPKARRWTVFDCPETYLGNKRYFDAIQQELANGGLEAMLYDLLHMPLGEFHPRVGYKTAALQDQKRESLEPAWKALEMILQDGVLAPGAAPANAASLAAIVGHARDMVPFLKTRTDKELRDAMKSLGATARRDNTGFARLWYFPPLPACRAAWEGKFGPWKWDPAEDWGVEARSVEEILNSRLDDIRH